MTKSSTSFRIENHIKKVKLFENCNHLVNNVFLKNLFIYGCVGSLFLC